MKEYIENPYRTPKEYVETLNGGTCPACGTREIEALMNTQPLSNDATIIVETIVCTDEECGAMWEDEYTLTGYRNLRESNLYEKVHKALEK